MKVIPGIKQSAPVNVLPATSKAPISQPGPTTGNTNTAIDLVGSQVASLPVIAKNTTGRWEALVRKAIGHANVPVPKTIPFDDLLCPFTLRLEREDGETTRIPAHNYYITADGKPRPYIKRLAEEALSRSPEVQKHINENLTKDYARYEMSFRVKNHDTGMYDKIFEVPTNGLVAPIKEEQFNKLVKSTEPVMKALRVLLQKIYSAEEITAESLGLTSLPDEDQEKIVATIKESIYFEPSVAGPEMKDYPFLAVAGFDAAVGNLDRVDPVFFEFNLGTPSGLSNNIQLLQLIEDQDPKLFNTIRHNLPEDDTYEILRNAIESNAKAWTGSDDGISVVVSPGVFNGAHPDVASIAMFTGMPLVRPKDMYQDATGAIRLSTGDASKDPTITGIYGRAEESFFLQSHEDGIFMKSPAYSDNQALCEKLGVKMQPGILYKFKSDSDGNIFGVETDENGDPIPAESFDRIGLDPARPDAKPGSFLKAIKSRKLYYSALGGRTVDDKRIFQALSKYLAPGYMTDVPVNKRAETVARPPKTLMRDEYEAFYSDPKLENYVVKEPDRSGGDGIYLMVNLTDEERVDVVNQVKANPDHFIVQEFAEFALMTAPEENTETGDLVFGSQANDWRLFIMMDGEGNVEAGPNSLLLRTAQIGSASTNTSQGGGYGIGVVVSETAKLRPMGTRSIPNPKRSSHIGVERKRGLVRFLQGFNDLTVRSDPRSSILVPRNGSVSHLAHQQRKLMDVVGRDVAGFMTVCREYDDGVIGQGELHREMLKYRELFYDHSARPVAGLDRLVETVLGEYNSAPSTLENGVAMAPVVEKSTLMSMLTMEPLPGGEFKVRETHDHEASSDTSEFARYTACADKTIQTMLDRVSKLGGEVRMTRSGGADGSSVLGAFINPYFRVTKEGLPVIGIDLTQDFALTAFAHELEHMEMFREVEAKIKAEDDSLSGSDLAEAAKKATLTTKMRVEGERRSIAAEIAVETNQESVFNRGTSMRARTSLEEGFVARMMYPEVEGIRDVLHAVKWSDEEVDIAEAKELLEIALRFAMDARKKSHDYYSEQAATLESEGSEESLIEARRFHFLAYHMGEKSVFKELFKYDLNRFEADGTASMLFELYKTITGEMDGSEFAINSNDEARINQQIQEQE